MYRCFCSQRPLFVLAWTEPITFGKPLNGVLQRAAVHAAFPILPLN